MAKTDILESTVEVPDLVGRHITAARLRAEERGLALRCGDEDGFVVWQFPAADRIAIKNDDILVSLASPGNDRSRMADLTGLSIREASAYLDFLRVEFTIKGRGRVVKQSMSPGETISGDKICRLTCKPT